MLPRVARIAGHSFLPRGLGPRGSDQGATVIDAGANVGAFALPVSRRWGARVVCVEPLPSLAEELRRRGLGVVQAALAATPGEATLSTYRGTCPSLHGMERGDRTARVTVPTMTLAQLAAEQAPDGIALLKLDIEGPESELLLSAPEPLLLAIGQVTVEFHDFLDPALAPLVDRAVARLEGLGFQLFRMSRDRSDLLFVNPVQLPLSPLERLWMRYPYRLARGVARNLRRRIGPLRRRMGGWEERNE